MPTQESEKSFLGFFLDFGVDSFRTLGVQGLQARGGFFPESDFFRVPGQDSVLGVKSLCLSCETKTSLFSRCLADFEPIFCQA